MQQHVSRQIYIELKIEVTRNCSRIVDSIIDQWFCHYCISLFFSKLHLTNYWVHRCSYGLVNGDGSRIQLYVYPNLKTTQQGKNRKVTLQRMDIEQSLHDCYVWSAINHEL